MRESIEGLDLLPERSRPVPGGPLPTRAANHLNQMGFELDPGEDGGVIRMSAPLGGDPRWAEFARPAPIPGWAYRSPIALECRYRLGEDEELFKVRRRALFVGGVAFFDAEMGPLEDARYEVRANDAAVMHALSGARGSADVLPFGDPIALGSLPYMNLFVACPPGAAFISVRYLLVPDINDYVCLIRERGAEYPVLPRRRDVMKDGMLWSVIHQVWNKGPRPARDFYHRSRHPPIACKKLLCFEPTAALCACVDLEAADAAAAVIQRAALEWLYAPGGPLFRRAESRFEQRAKK